MNRDVFVDVRRQLVEIGEPDLLAERKRLERRVRSAVLELPCDT